MSDLTLQDARFRFYGKVMALCTHELRNHLAIIRESAGLIEDALEFNRGQKLDLSKPLQNIDRQAVRSTNFLKVMSSFCHRLDCEVSSFLLTELLDELLILINRYLNQREIEVVKNYPTKDMKLKNNPAIIQFVLFCFVERLSDKSVVELTLSEGGQSCCIQLKTNLPFKDISQETPSVTPEILTEACRLTGIDLDLKKDVIELTIKKSKEEG